jgi:hypothetical protein
VSLFPHLDQAQLPRRRPGHRRRVLPSTVRAYGGYDCNKSEDRTTRSWGLWRQIRWGLDPRSGEREIFGGGFDFDRLRWRLDPLPGWSRSEEVRVVQPQQELRTVGMPWKGMATRYGSEEMARRVMASWPWIRGRGRLWRREQPGVGRREGARPGAEWSAVVGPRPRTAD